MFVGKGVVQLARERMVEYDCINVDTEYGNRNGLQKGSYQFQSIEAVLEESINECNIN